MSKDVNNSLGKKKVHCCAFHLHCLICLYSFLNKILIQKAEFGISCFASTAGKISRVTKNVELGVLCNIPFYLQRYLFQTGQFAPVPTTMPNKVRFLPQLSTTK